MNQLENYLHSLPPSNVNNSRAIVRGLIERFNTNPSESLAQKIEEITGLDADYSNKDVDGPKEYN